ncbi:hypothetical protein [Methanolobus sp. WCC5]|uniref:hypothetical protein n=1 Tax=Methanolobus sp. WCC5 TaxID=3125785 RepID=UPI00324CEBF2
MTNLNTMVGIVIGLMIIVVVSYLTTGVGEQVANALPVNATGDFANVPTGASILETNMAIVSITILIIIISVGIGAIRGLQNKGNE